MNLYPELKESAKRYCSKHCCATKPMSAKKCAGCPLYEYVKTQKYTTKGVE